MADFNSLFEQVQITSTESALLVGLLCTTSLSAILTWQSNTQLRLISSALEQDSSDYEDGVTTDEIDELLNPHIWNIYGSTRKGQIRSENQDAFIIIDNGDQKSLGVFDGVGGAEGGKEASNSAAALFKDYIESTQISDLLPLEKLEGAIAYIRAVFNADEIIGLTTAILANIEDDTLYYATLGDGNLVIVWPDGMIQQVLVPHHERGLPSNVISAHIGGRCDVAPRIGMIRLEPNCTVMLMSDGAGDLFPYDDYADERELYWHILTERTDSNLADHFLFQLESARDPETEAYYHHDNMTLVMAHLSTVIDGGENA